MSPTGKRAVYFVSDHTGVTAEVLGHSLLARFEERDLLTTTRPFVNSVERADELVAELAALPDQPIVFSTITEQAVRERISAAVTHHLDLFSPFIEPLEEVFGYPAATRIGAAHGIRDLARYQARIDAVEFSLATDDGSNTNRYPQAEAVMIGVSRVGKSPTCLYLAMQYGVRASNYPLADDDFERSTLPQPIAPYGPKLFGLTIQPQRLYELRQRRRPNSEYASMPRCEYEVRRAESLFRQHGVPFVDVTHLSVEELAATLLQRRRLPT